MPVPTATANLLPLLDLRWEVGPTRHSGIAPEKFVPAAVPGAVQLDWARAHGWPDHAFGEEALRYRGLEDFWWVYRCELPPFEAGDRSPWLVLPGVDHAATLLLDGRVLGECRGLQVPAAFPLAGAKSGSAIEIRVHPAPKEPGQEGRTRASRTTKPAVSYGWDFHPDLIPLGLWRGARVELRPAAHLARLDFRYRLADNFGRAEFAVRATCGAGRLSVRLIDRGGAEVWGRDDDVPEGDHEWWGALDDPQLWWPAGHGPQARYRVRATLCDGAGEPLHVLERTVGFRRARLEMAPGQWDEPSAFPKSRSLPPMTLSLNGRRIFAKGANVPPLDIFPGAVTAERARELVAQAAGANMNLLRVWGGGPAPDDAFYDACDELGVMVLQEFPLACNPYPDDPLYLRDLEVEARALIDRLAPRPCLVVWSGGNELFNAWSGMTDQSHAVRLLGALTYREDPDTPFLDTLPVEGLGHGYYLFRDPPTGRECFQMAQSSRCTGLTEFGVPAPADAEVIRALLSPEEHWPPREEGAWRLHAGSHAWDVEPTSYMCLSTLEHYWGEIRDLDDAVARGQWLQCFGLQAIFEEARRQRPFCSWALCWCLNEPWPNFANSTLLTYPLRPKPALAAVREALRPTLASARIPKFQWRPGETFSAELFVLHDAPHPRPGLSVEAWLTSGLWRQKLASWEAPSGAPDTDLAGPTVRCVLPDRLGDDLVLELLAGDAACSSRYRMATGAPQRKASEHRGLNQ